MVAQLLTALAAQVSPACPAASIPLARADTASVVAILEKCADGLGKMEWGRTTAVAADRAIEWLQIALPDLSPGFYRVSVRVTDAATDGTTVRERSFRVAR